MKNFNFVILLLIFTFPCSLYAEERVVNLATLTDFAPYCFRKENSTQLQGETIPPGSDSSQLQGYSWDIVRESFHERGFTIKLFVVPWARVMHYLKSGKVDAIFPANRTAQREKEFSFSKEFVDRTKMVVYVPVTSSIEWKNGLDSLNGLNVGVVRGWAYGKKWEGNHYIKKHTMDSILQSFLVMDKNRLDAVIGYEIAYDFVLKDKGIADKFIKIGSFGLVDEYLMGKSDNPRAKHILNDFDQGHSQIEQKGNLDKIQTKWQ